MTYPILEFDSTKEAFIEPSKVIQPRGIPKHCVVCFFQDVISKVVEVHKGKVLVENRWEDGPHPLYEIEYKGKRLGIFHPGVGSALASSILEEVIAFGGRKFVACGGCGVLDKDLSVGNLIVVSSAIRDEGASYHYLPPSREVIAQKPVILAFEKILNEQKLPYCIGKTWTTDAPYRETSKKIELRKQEECLVVEMEAAGMMAVAEFRQVMFGQILYGGDSLAGEDWDNRDWQKKSDIRENLFWLCAEACLSL